MTGRGGCWRGDERDLLERLVFVRPVDVRLSGTHRYEPLAFFNGSIAVLGGEVLVLARAVLGYYRYVSVLVESLLPIEDLVSLKPGSRLSLNARIAVEPLGEWGFWGVEDPRLTLLQGEPVAVYTGRTQRYFETGETVNIVAARSPAGSWKPQGLLLEAPPGTHVSEKNGALTTIAGELVALTRIHTRSGVFKAVIGEAVEAPWGVKVEASDALEPARGEDKLGWATPAGEDSKGRVILVHAVTSRDKAYKLLAVKAEQGRDGPRIVSYSRGYIMRPSHPLERHGDRPLTIYPTGAVEVDEYTYITYGAADLSLGIARIETQQLHALAEECNV